MSKPLLFNSGVGRHLFYASVVHDTMSDIQSSLLKGWRCGECGSWDVYATILGEEESNYVVHKQ